jgi:hypothetical protein
LQKISGQTIGLRRHRCRSPRRGPDRAADDAQPAQPQDALTPVGKIDRKVLRSTVAADPAADALR